MISEIEDWLAARRRNPNHAEDVHSEDKPMRKVRTTQDFSHPFEVTLLQRTAETLHKLIPCFIAGHAQRAPVAAVFLALDLGRRVNRLEAAQHS
jgi:hypothetical protein